MIVIADTSPLNYLIILELIDVLREAYGWVIVPTAVLEEMRHPAAPGSDRRWAAAPPPWIEERLVTEPRKDLSVELDPGELHAISLALELNADWLLMDERIGRLEAERCNIPVTGTLNVLLEASRRGRCQFPETVVRLRAAGARISASVERTMMARLRDER